MDLFRGVLILFRVSGCIVHSGGVRIVIPRKKTAYLWTLPKSGPDPPLTPIFLDTLMVTFIQSDIGKIYHQQLPKNRLKTTQKLLQ